MAAARDAIGVGVRENVVAAAMLGAMAEAGADAIVSYPQCSTDALRRMGTDSRLRSGQTLLLDINVGDNGYVGDFARTFIVGKPSSDQKRVFSAQMQCMQESFEAIRPGATTQSIQDAVAKVVHAED